MKSLILAMLVGTASIAAAQNTQPICGIYYDYDALGNRIKRSHACRSHPDPNGTNENPDPGNYPNSRLSPSGKSTSTPLASGVKVYPNPTNGPYTIELPQAWEKPVHFHWYDAHGQILTSGQIVGKEARGSIGSLPDGVYLLQVYLPGGTQSFRVTKLTGTP